MMYVCIISSNIVSVSERCWNILTSCENNLFHLLRHFVPKRLPTTDLLMHSFPLRLDEYVPAFVGFAEFQMELFRRLCDLAL